MHEALFRGLVEKLAKLTREQDQALRRAETGEQTLALRGGQAVGVAGGVHAAKPMAQKALTKLRYRGPKSKRTKLLGAYEAAKAMGLVAGTTAGSGIAAKRVTQKVQRYKRNKFQGVKGPTAGERAHAIAEQAKKETGEVARIPGEYQNIRRG